MPRRTKIFVAPSLIDTDSLTETDTEADVEIDTDLDTDIDTDIDTDMDRDMDKDSRYSAIWITCDIYGASSNSAINL